MSLRGGLWPDEASIHPMTIKNIAFYLFFKPSIDLRITRNTLHSRMLDLGIKGTILLASEGINSSFAGTTENIDAFLTFLFDTLGIKDPVLKISYSETIPFKRARVRLKKYIVVAPGKTPLDLSQDKAPYISPEEFHQWILENKKMLILDTRNDYEYRVGRFKNSIHLGTKHFADFEEDLQKTGPEWKATPIVTFCTGGIRCEKAAPLMVKKGFTQVYQLDGGILNYFQKIGQGHFEGECFVFDERVALDENLSRCSPEDLTS